MTDAPTPPDGWPVLADSPSPEVIAVSGVRSASGPVTGAVAAGGAAPGQPAAAARTAVAPPAGRSRPGGPGQGRRGGKGRPPGPPRRGSRSRGSRWRLAFFALSGVVVLGLGLFALFGDRLLVVRSISVSGTRQLLPVQVTQAAAVPVGTPLLNVDTGAVTRRVEALTLVASASVTREWPDILVIKVTERKPVMALKMADASYDLVDSDGVVTGNVKARPAGLPQLKTVLPGAALRGSTAVGTAAGVLAELPAWLSKQVASVSPSALGPGNAQVTLGLTDGKTVVWGGTDHAAQKERELKILLPGQAGRIDVSSPGTVVTR
jgi:cell division protein FtsQ